MARGPRPASPRTLTGTRIRERRLALRLKQADLARGVGISPAYLNLIEHNRRQPGADLLERLAAGLETDPGALSGGGEDALFQGLREAAGVETSTSRVELDRIEEFVSRFPGWAALLAARQGRVVQLEQALVALSDRMTQDPYLADTLHEVLSAVTALRSTAAILCEDDEIDPEWQARFHRMLHEDSRRAAQTAEALAAYLDRIEGDGAGGTTPLDEVEDWFGALDWHLPEGDPDAAVCAAAQLVSTTGRALAAQWLARLTDEARRLPVARLSQGDDPLDMATAGNLPLGLVLRRIGLVRPEAGLVICDAAGALTLRRVPPGFSLPRLGAGCPLWPLFSALGQPGRPIRARIEMAGRASQRFLVYALAEPRLPLGLEGPAANEAMMLILPDPGGAAAPLPVGPGCRICPRPDCAARREPSIMAAPVQAG